MKMSRPASAACDRCQISVFSLSGSDSKPSAYNCTTDASSTFSSRYLRSAPLVEDAAAPEAVGCAGGSFCAGPEHAAPHVATRKRERKTRGRISGLSSHWLTGALFSDTRFDPPRRAASAARRHPAFDLGRRSRRASRHHLRIAGGDQDVVFDADADAIVPVERRTLCCSCADSFLNTSLATTSSFLT